MENPISKTRLMQLRQKISELGYKVSDESLYDVAVALVRFVAVTEDFHNKNNSMEVNND